MSLKRLIPILILPVLWGTAFAYEIQFATHNIEGKTYINEKGELRGKNTGGEEHLTLSWSGK